MRVYDLNSERTISVLAHFHEKNAVKESLLVGGVDQLIFEDDGPNLIQAVAPDGVSGLIDISAPNVDVCGSLNLSFSENTIADRSNTAHLSSPITCG